MVEEAGSIVLVLTELWSNLENVLAQERWTGHKGEVKLSGVSGWLGVTLTLYLQ